MPRPAADTNTTLEAYCPHCFLLVESDVSEGWPAEPTRCPHCRLLIGEGRAKPTADANPGARGTAAGVKELADAVAIEAERLENEVRHFLTRVQAA